MFFIWKSVHRPDVTSVQLLSNVFVFVHVTRVLHSMCTHVCRQVLLEAYRFFYCFPIVSLLVPKMLPDALRFKRTCLHTCRSRPCPQSGPHDTRIQLLSHMFVCIRVIPISGWSSMRRWPTFIKVM